MKAILASIAMIFLSLPVLAQADTETRLTFPDGQVQAVLSWAQGPDAKGGESIMNMEWHDGSTHALVDPGAFTVTLWMPSMGHGSAPTMIQNAVDANGQSIIGAYQVRNMYFIMPGEWDVQVSLTLPNGQTETQVLPVKIEGSMGGHHRH